LSGLLIYAKEIVPSVKKQALKSSYPDHSLVLLCADPEAVMYSLSQ